MSDVTNRGELRIRRATAADAPAIAAIHADSFVHTYAGYPATLGAAATGRAGRKSHWQSHLAANGTLTLVADLDGVTVGFVDVGFSPDTDADASVGHIRSIHVDPDQVGAGVGKGLMRSAENVLGEIGCGEATLWVVADNERARSFYSRLGWTPDGNHRLEKLAVGDEEGDLVEVIRYHKNLTVDGRMT